MIEKQGRNDTSGKKRWDWRVGRLARATISRPAGAENRFVVPIASFSLQELTYLVSCLALHCPFRVLQRDASLHYTIPAL